MLSACSWCPELENRKDSPTSLALLPSHGEVGALGLTPPRLPVAASVGMQRGMGLVAWGRWVAQHSELSTGVEDRVW